MKFDTGKGRHEQVWQDQPRCSCKWACSILENYRLSVLSRSEDCYALQKITRTRFRVSRPGESHPEALAELYVSLDSYSSHHRATPHPHLPVGKQLRITSRNARDPPRRPTEMMAQLLVFPLGPEGKISV